MNYLRRQILKSGGFRFTAFVAVVLVVCVVLSIVFWKWLSAGESGSTTIRNIGLIAVGVIALPLAIWRGIVAERQAATAQQGLLNERYQKGAEMLGSHTLSVRLGGIYALEHLTVEHPGKYHLRTMELFCAFVRHPVEDKALEALDRRETQGHQNEPLRQDVKNYCGGNRGPERGSNSDRERERLSGRPIRCQP